jgi:hypothetical protein
MPPKKVLQYQCDRCPSLWYADENKPEPPCSIEIKADFGDSGQPIVAKFDCLCPSCRQTVYALARQISKTLQKVSAIRVAKKKKDDTKAETADKAVASSATPSMQTAPAVTPPSTNSETSPLARNQPSSAPVVAVVAVAAAGKPLPLVAGHPKR